MLSLQNPDSDGDLSLPTRALNTALLPFQIATSRPARRAYLTTALLTLLALSLLPPAFLAYTLFYAAYIPRISFSRPLHLQYDDVLHPSHPRYDAQAQPYAVVDLGHEVVSQQAYDVEVELEVPRTRAMRGVGVFMVEGVLFAPGLGGVVEGVKDTLAPGQAERDNHLRTVRRAASLEHRSLPLEVLSRVMELPFYVVGWRRESEVVGVMLWQGVEFSRGWRNVPREMRVELQSLGRVEVYKARVEWRARLRGLRWIMFRWKITSAVIGVLGFWGTEVLFAGLAWAVVRWFWQGRSAGAVKKEADVKAEPASEDENDQKMSDTERTFPSGSKQQVLRYESPPVKDEPADEDFPADEDALLEDVPTRATEADDEDEDEDLDTFVDSGLGTGMESSASRSDSVRKRRARREE